MNTDLHTNDFRAMFYIFLTGFLCYESYFLARLPASGTEFIWLADILYSFIPFSPWHPPLFFLIVLALSILCIFRDSWVLRTFAFIFLVLLFSIKFSFSTVSHSRHIWFFASFFFIFINSRTHLDTTRNHLVIRLIQCTLLLQYFSSGLWKFMALEKLSFDYFKEVIFEHIAHSVMLKESQSIAIVTDTLVCQYPSVLALGFVFSLIFELFSIVPILTGRYFCFFGFYAILFNIMANMIIGVSFVPNIIAAIYFLVYAEKTWKLPEPKPDNFQEAASNTL